jgi:hypothetical protein
MPFFATVVTKYSTVYCWGNYPTLGETLCFTLYLGKRVLYGKFCKTTAHRMCNNMHSTTFS